MSVASAAAAASYPPFGVREALILDGDTNLCNAAAQNYIPQ